MLALFTTAALAISTALGEDAVYTVTATGATISVLAIIERDVMTPVANLAPGIAERRTLITLRTAALAGVTPVLGDRIQCGTEAWKVLAIEQDDGYLVRLKVRSTT